jgi:hypothetical protein
VEINTIGFRDCVDDEELPLSPHPANINIVETTTQLRRALFRVVLVLIGRLLKHTVHRLASESTITYSTHGGHSRISGGRRRRVNTLQFAAFGDDRELHIYANAQLTSW